VSRPHQQEEKADPAKDRRARQRITAEATLFEFKLDFARKELRSAGGGTSLTSLRLVGRTRALNRFLRKRLVSL